jgi:hypothetical protein
MGKMKDFLKKTDYGLQPIFVPMINLFEKLQILIYPF